MINPGSIKDKKEFRATSVADIHAEALKRFDDIMDREQDNRELGVEDARFAQTQNGMWDDDTEEDTSPDVPKYTFNLVSSAIDQITGDHRQNDVSIKVRPAGEGADKRDADIFNGLIRNIMNQSDFEDINNNAFDETLNSGYGGYRVVTQFTNDDVNLNAFDQEAMIEPINSAVTSLFFGPAKKYDKSDALYAFLVWNETLTNFKAQYPDAQITDFQEEIYQKEPYVHWFDTNDIRLAEYWRKVPIKRKIGLVRYPPTPEFPNGQRMVIDLEDEKKVLDDLAVKGVEILRTREVDDWEIERYIMNGAEILKPVEKWAGKIIPLIPEFGKVSHIDNQVYVRGLVRFAKDAQRVYNYLRSTIVSVISKAPKDPYWATTKQAEGHRQQWERMNVSDDPVMLYEPDERAPGPPQRSGGPQVPAALIEAAQTARLDVQAGMGVTANTQQPTAGTDIDRRSGEAINAQARRGDTGAYSFMANHALSIQALGNVLVDLIPRIYDSTRTVTVLREDGTTEEVTINQTQKDAQSGEVEIVNDLSKGKYSVTVDIGPAFATQRMEAADRLIRMSEDPNSPYAKLTPDLIAKFLDLPGDASEELHKRLRGIMIQQGVATPTEEEAQELQPTEAQKLEAALKQRREEAEIDLIESQAIDLKANAEKKTAEIDNIDFDTNKKAVDAFNKLVETLAAKAEAGMPLTIQDADLVAGQEDLVEDSAQTIAPGPNSNQKDILPNS